MKKIPALLLVMLVLAGCSKAGGGEQTVPSAPETTPAAVTTEATQAPTAETAAETTGKVVSPMESFVNPDELGDCTVSVGFTPKDDAYVDDGGKFVIRMDLYDYEQFDMVDMSTLEVGDTIVVGGKNVTVNTLTGEGGDKLINGGFDQGGYTIRPGNGGMFYTVGANDQLSYYKVGEAVVPVAQEFQMNDCSDPGVGERVLLAGDLLTEAPESNAVYGPNNTIATISGGQLMNITVNYMP